MRWGIKQEENGWLILGVEMEAGTLRRIDWHPVVFDVRSEAEVELAEWLKAPVDETGRRVRSAEDIQLLVRTVVHRVPACKEATYFGGVAKTKPDALGCNWVVSTSSHDDGWEDCQAQVGSTMLSLRASLNLAA